MSDHADPSKARWWLDGDGFRAPVGTDVPADIFASSLDGWDAFGGIRAGFTVTPEQDVTDEEIWNGNGIYMSKVDPAKWTIEFEPVDLSKATVGTILRGGSLTSLYGGYAAEPGDSEEFALIMRGVSPGKGKIAFLVKRGTLSQDAAWAINADNISGYPLSVKALDPGNGEKSIIPIFDTNLLGSVDATGATAGIPGSFTPSGATAPANLAAMSDITASPTTGWTTGQYVTLGDASKAYWDGDSWESGTAS